MKLECVSLVFALSILSHRPERKMNYIKVHITSTWILNRYSLQQRVTTNQNSIASLWWWGGPPNRCEGDMKQWQICFCVCT